MTCEIHTLLVLRELTATIINQTLGVNEPDLATRFLLGQALELEEAHELHGYSDSGGTGTQEENAVVGKRTSGGCGGQLRGVHESGEHDGAGALDVIVEHRVAVTEGLEILEGVLSREVLRRVCYFQ